MYQLMKRKLDLYEKNMSKDELKKKLLNHQWDLGESVRPWSK